MRSKTYNLPAPFDTFRLEKSADEYKDFAVRVVTENIEIDDIAKWLEAHV